MSRGGNESARARGEKDRTQTGFTGIDAATERMISQLIERSRRKQDSTDAAFKEKIEVLLGERGKKTDAALRRGDMVMALEVLPEISAAPTMADYNNLVAAFNALLVKLADLSRKQ